MAFDKVLLVTIAEAEKGSWTAKHWAFWSVYMSVLTLMQNDQSRHSQRERIQCVLPRSPARIHSGITVWSYGMFPKWMYITAHRTCLLSSILSPVDSLAALWSRIKEATQLQIQREKEQERNCAFLTTTFKSEIYRILHWLLFSNNFLWVNRENMLVTATRQQPK